MKGSNATSLKLIILLKDRTPDVGIEKSKFYPVHQEKSFLDIMYEFGLPYSIDKIIRIIIFIIIHDLIKFLKLINFFFYYYILLRGLPPEKGQQKKYNI